MSDQVPGASSPEGVKPDFKIQQEDLSPQGQSNIGTFRVKTNSLGVPNVSIKSFDGLRKIGKEVDGPVTKTAPEGFSTVLNLQRKEKNEILSFEKLGLLSQELLLLENDFSELVESPFLSDSDKKRLNEEVNKEKLDFFRKAFGSINKIPDTEIYNKLKRDVSRASAFADHYKKIAEANKEVWDKEKEREMSVSTEKESQLTRQIDDISPKNISYSSEKGKWKIIHENGRYENLTNQEDMRRWEITLGTLRDYKSFISNIPEEKRNNYGSLITLKDELLYAIETEQWDKEEILQQQLENGLLEAKNRSSYRKKEGAKSTAFVNRLNNVPDTNIDATSPVPTPPDTSAPPLSSSPLAPDVSPTPEKRRRAEDVVAKNIRFDKTTSKFTIKENGAWRVMAPSEYTHWKYIDAVLKHYRSFMDSKETAHVFSNLIPLKNTVLDTIEAGHIDVAEKYVKELVTKLHEATEVRDSVRRYNLEKLGETITLSPKDTSFAFIKDIYRDPRIINKKTGEAYAPPVGLVM